MKALRQYALKLLSRRDYSEWELSQKLHLKGFLNTDIKTIIAEFVRLNWLNDDRYTRQYIVMKRNRGYGPRHIMPSLKQKGIADETIKQHLYDDENHWSSSLMHVWQKRFKSTYPKDFTSKAKQARLLMNRGFSGEQIERLFSQLNKIVCTLDD